jgi:peroxiredoxin Q/BCP
VKAGDEAPEFELFDDTGEIRRLRDLLQAGPVVLFFYPAAMSPGCTIESCHFRDLASEFAAVGAQRVGISADKVDKQKKFSDKHQFDFPLLSDPDGAVARAYGVRRSFALLATKRATFVIGTDGRILEVIASEVRMKAHADQALETLRRSGSSRGA